MSYSPTDIGYFLAVVREGHLGRAAAAMGVTQPAMSKALRRLEAAVGVSLLERGSLGARLTGDGHLFHQSALRFDAQHAQLLRCGQDLRAHSAGLLRVGLTNAAGDSAPVRALAQLVRHRPGLRVALTIDRSDKLNQAVERGEIDLAVVPSYPGHAFSAQQLDLRADEAVAAARRGHPLFQLSAPTLQDAAAHPWVMASAHSVVRQLLSDRFAAVGLPPLQVALEVDYMSQAAMGLLAGTDLLALVPRSVLRDWTGRIDVLPIEALRVQRRLVLLSRASVAFTPLMAAFQAALLEEKGASK